MFRQSRSVQITQQEDPVHQRKGRWCSSLPPERRPLFHGPLMRAGLLTEGPPLGENAIVCGSKPQRSHFLRLMFHSDLSTQPGTTLSIHSVSDNAAELITCMCNSPFVSSIPCGTSIFFFLHGIMSMYLFLQFVFHAALCVLFIFTSGCYSSTGNARSMSSDFARLLR